MNYTGIACSKGIGIGKVLKISDNNDIPNNYVNSANELCKPNIELSRFDAAISCYKERLALLSKSLDKSLGEKQGDIIRSHLVILDDEDMLGQIYKLIDTGKSADESVYDVLNVYDLVSYVFYA